MARLTIKPEDLARLNLQALLTSLASLGVLLMGLICITLYFKPSLFSVTLEAYEDYRGKIVWLVLGMILTLSGSVFLYTTTCWPWQLRQIVSNTQPIKMLLKIEVEEDSSSTTYHAVISQRSNETERTDAWRAQIWVHPPQVKQDIDQQFECNVFFHPAENRPVAIEYARGVLWVMAGSGSVKRLPNVGSTGI
jgi:hypothetical protein